MAISDTLKQKAGPLPVWAWGVIVGVIVVAGMYWYSSKSASNGSVTDDSELLAYPDLDGGSGDGSGSNTGTVVTGGTGSSGAQEFTSSLAWMTYAVAALIKDGFSPLAVQSALSKYLSGDTLSASEQQIVNIAITRYGMPPFGTDGPPSLAPVTDTGDEALIPGKTPAAGIKVPELPAGFVSKTENGNYVVKTPVGTVTVPVVTASNGSQQVIGGANTTATGATADRIRASQKANIQANIAQFEKDHPKPRNASDTAYLAKMYAQLATFG